MSSILQTDRFPCLYEILKKLDVGRFGHVFLCRHKHNMKEYAVKFVSETKMAAIYIRREAAICLRLDHRNIVKLVEFHNDKTKFLYQLVFEMAWEGELYDDIIKIKVRYSELEASHCLEQILQGVAFIHKNEFVHRDLKPDNILLTYTENCTVVKIADFGDAIPLSDDEVFQYEGDKDDAGCFSYCLAPEMQFGEFCSHSIDIWACGAILYFMIYGKPPFVGEGDALFSQMMNEGPDEGEIPGISDYTKSLIAEFLNSDEENRPTAESALTHPFITNQRSVSSRFHRHNIEAESTSFLIDEREDYASTSMTTELNDPNQNMVNVTNDSPAVAEEKTSPEFVQEDHACEKQEALEASLERSPALSGNKMRSKAPKMEASSASSSCSSKSTARAASSTSNKKQVTFSKPTRRSARRAAAKSRLSKTEVTADHETLLNRSRAVLASLACDADLLKTGVENNKPQK